jgi:hypothetical protein
MLWEKHAQKHASEALRFKNLDILRREPDAFKNMIKAVAEVILN